MTDKRDLKPASENPWYVLMTVAGEQTRDTIDSDLHARNRRYWNGWAAEALSDEDKVKLVEDGRPTENYLLPLNGDERTAIVRAIEDRCGATVIPEPGEGVDLGDTEFSKGLACAGFIFSRYANFGGATFSRYANFRGAAFSGNAGFRGATFSEYANFGLATFSGIASFEGATFSRYANFGGATFSGDANFGGAAFSGNADFEEITFSGDADFRGVTFSGNADFSDSGFKSRTVFADARFPPPHASPPRFFSATLHEDTNWTDVAWPDPPRTREEAIGHRRAYERLKLVMDSQNKFHDEHMFLRMELRCREIEEPNSWASWASRLFRWTSDYGWSIQRPSAGLGITLALGWALIFIAEWFEHWFGSNEY